jgi:hypothetical protein
MALRRIRNILLVLDREQLIITSIKPYEHELHLTFLAIERSADQPVYLIHPRNHKLETSDPAADLASLQRIRTKGPPMIER